MELRRNGRVLRITSERADLQELLLEIDGTERAGVCYPQLTGRVSEGESVEVNTIASDLGLGTGGVDFVVSGSAFPPPHLGSGHVMKLRYTPWQFPVLAVEEPVSQAHGRLATANTVGLAPVVCAELHSQIPAVAAAARWETGGAARIALVMDDSAALPAAFSHTIPALRRQELLHSVVTCGQAFGGDLEAVCLYSGILAAQRVAGADIIIVAPGPGTVGTATEFGFSGVAQGQALNAAVTLDALPIAVVRLAAQDPRPRHLGISHHSLTVLNRIVLAPVTVALPLLDDEFGAELRRCVENEILSPKHDYVFVDAGHGLQALLESGVPGSTMGRTIKDERAFFMAAAAAGLVAGQCANERRREIGDS
jgi:hypothetical protein